MEKTYLPIGSVVLLKDAEKELMIVGYSSIDEDEPDKIYDYMACPYPEGLIDMEEVELFQNDQIDKILFEGYVTKDFQEYTKEVESLTLEYLDDKHESEVIESN